MKLADAVLRTRRMRVDTLGWSLLILAWLFNEQPTYEIERTTAILLTTMLEPKGKLKKAAFVQL